MSINFTGREGCPHVGASATSLVFEKVLGALNESQANLAATETARDAATLAQSEAEAARDTAVSAKDAAESAKQDAQSAESDAQTAKADAESANSATQAAKSVAESARDDAVTAKTAAETAEAGAINAKTDAESAKTAAVNAKVDAEIAKADAVNAKEAAETAKSGAESAKIDAISAKDAAEAARAAAVNAKNDAEAAKTDAESAKTDAVSAKDAAETAKDNAITARDEARAAMDTAKQYSGKPAKSIGGTWWIWNAEAGEYEDSGASSILSIQHSYHSIAAMNADFSNTNKNDMAIISSSVEEDDTAKLYINNGTEWGYLCDLSGVQGAKGDAATVTVGTVTVGEAGSTPSVTNVGTSAAAVLNFVIPKGDTGDKGATGDKGDTGNGISGITLASGNHAPGTLDTYTIQLTNGEEFSFQVYNGTNGSGAGDLMANGSVPMTGDLNAGGNKVTNLAPPTADTDAVRKSDLDNLIIASATQPSNQSVGDIWCEVL